MSKEPIQLYSPKDVKEARDTLLKRQGGVDPITGLKIPKGKEVLDHDHDSQFVRAVLHNHTNVALGKIENTWKRYLVWWYSGTLPDFLRGCADYIEREQPREYLHPAFIKKLQIEFNKLRESDKSEVLKWLGESDGSNSAERKKTFRKSIMKKDKSYFEVLRKLQAKNKAKSG